MAAGRARAEARILALVAAVLLTGCPALPQRVRTARSLPAGGWASNIQGGVLTYRRVAEYPQTSIRHEDREANPWICAGTSGGLGEGLDIGLDIAGGWFFTGVLRWQFLGADDPGSVASALVVEAASTPAFLVGHSSSSNSSGGLAWAWTLPAGRMLEVNFGGRVTFPWRVGRNDLFNFGGPNQMENGELMPNVRYADAWVGVEVAGIAHLDVTARFPLSQYDGDSIQTRTSTMWLLAIGVGRRSNTRVLE